MNNNLNKKLEGVLSSVNPAELQKLMKLAKGSSIASKLSESDKQKILKEFAELDTGVLKKKLASFKAEDLNGLSADEILKRIKRK